MVTPQHNTRHPAALGYMGPVQLEHSEDMLKPGVLIFHQTREGQGKIIAYTGTVA
jgi:hypothetical protein